MSRLTAWRFRAKLEGRGPVRSEPACLLLLGTPYEWGMMEVSIRGPVWRAPCPHPMSPWCSLRPDCQPCCSAGQGAGGVTGDFATVIALLDRRRTFYA